MEVHKVSLEGALNYSTQTLALRLERASESPGGLLQTRVPHPVSGGLGRRGRLAFLTSSWAMLVLLVHGPQCENQSGKNNTWAGFHRVEQGPQSSHSPSPASLGGPPPPSRPLPFTSRRPFLLCCGQSQSSRNNRNYRWPLDDAGPLTRGWSARVKTAVLLGQWLVASLVRGTLDMEGPLQITLGLTSTLFRGRLYFRSEAVGLSVRRLRGELYHPQPEGCITS